MKQIEALEILKSGKNVFLTGGPGSGKTYTINKFIEWCRENDKRVEVTASTGIAATHIGGITVHSWAGMGIKDKFTDSDITNILNKPWVMAKFTSANVLIIDEISMLDATFVDNLDRILSIARDGIVRDTSRRFGGLQVVFVGDFFQLPPVSKGREISFAFESDAWNNAGLLNCYITEQHRQEDDVFLDILTSLRDGTITKDHVSILRDRNVKPLSLTGVTQLFTHNIDVDRINDAALRNIKSETWHSEMVEDGNEYLVSVIKKGCLSPETLYLKVGALVMFTKNKFEEDEVVFVNGTIGTVVGFSAYNEPIVETKDGQTINVIMEEWSIQEGRKVIASIKQYPLRLAWALTVHKSQGMTLDSAIMDLSKSFEYGQGYVALSRVKSLDGLFLEGFNSHSLRMHPKVIIADKQFRI